MWIVAYDVRSDKSRRQVAKLLEKKGLRLQKSVFIVDGRPRAVRRLAREIANQVDLKTDRVNAWPLSKEWSTDQLAFPSESAPFTEEYLVI